jgi:hypothetical protein
MVLEQVNNGYGYGTLLAALHSVALVVKPRIYEFLGQAHRRDYR